MKQELFIWKQFYKNEKGEIIETKLNNLLVKIIEEGYFIDHVINIEKYKCIIIYHKL